ncbi:MAG: agenet domain-containing protein [Flavobacteriales bacterium]|jgi:hypothetical protein|nr:MAG: agenet domain-containing protein [Flavobacteriales bacterium]
MRVLLLPLLALLATSLNAQSVNDPVEIDYQGTWYPGTVLKVEAEKYFVTYDGWDESWNEWVGKERLRGMRPAEPAAPPPAPEPKYNVGDRVEIQFGFNTANATVVGVNATEGKYELKVDGMDTMWYTGDLIIRKL